MKVTLNFKALLAEFIGTFALSFMVLVSLNVSLPIPTPILAALTLGTFVYSVGSVSGTHINPAVTIGLASIKKIQLDDAVAYICSQFLGIGLAYMLTHFMLGEVTLLTREGSIAIMLAEAIGAFVFTFGISSVVNSKTPEQMSGVIVGASLLIGIMFASIGSYGILNPAVALATGTASWSYILGPIIGSLIGFNLYHFAFGEKK